MSDDSTDSDVCTIGGDNNSDDGLTDITGDDGVPVTITSEFPVEDIYEILENKGKGIPMTEERKVWREFVRELCKNRLKAELYTSDQKQKVALVFWGHTSCMCCRCL